MSQPPLPRAPQPEEQEEARAVLSLYSLAGSRKDTFGLWLLLNLHEVQSVPAFFPHLQSTQTAQQDVLACPSVPLPALSMPRFGGTPAEVQVLLEEDDG